MFSANTSDLECVVSITCTYVKDGGGGGGGGGTEMQGLRPFPVPSLECPLPPISPCIPQHIPLLGLGTYPGGKLMTGA